jgi:hypothetical protein
MGTPPSLSALLATCQHGEVDVSLIHTPPGNAEPTLEEVQQTGLLENIERHGQFVELILYPHPDITGHYFAADGNYRTFCLRNLGRPARALILPRAPTEDELLTLRVSLASTCKKVDRGLIGCDIFTWINLVPGRTERDAVDHFGLSAGYVNKLVSPFKNGIAELIEALKKHEIAPTAAPFVATLPQERQREILPRVLGKKRAAVKCICDTIKPERSKERGKPFKATVAGVTISMREAAPEKRVDKIRGLWSRIGEVLKQVEKEPRLAPVIVQLLAG